MRPNNEPIFAQILRKWQTQCSNYDIKFQTHTCVWECGWLSVCMSVCVSGVCAHSNAIIIVLIIVYMASARDARASAVADVAAAASLSLLLLSCSGSGSYSDYSLLFLLPLPLRLQSCCVIVSILIYVCPPTLPACLLLWQPVVPLPRSLVYNFNVVNQIA